MYFRPWMNKTLAAGLMVCFVTSCDSGSLQPQPGVIDSGGAHIRPELTADKAKDALVELLRRNPTAFQRKFDPDDLAKQPLVPLGTGGGYSCGHFRIHLAGSYQITVAYGCIFEYEGRFRFQDGRWVASEPYCTSAALVK